MKLTNFLWMLLLTLTMTACNKDDEPQPEKIDPALTGNWINYTDKGVSEAVAFRDNGNMLLFFEDKWWRGKYEVKSKNKFVAKGHYLHMSDLRTFDDYDAYEEGPEYNWTFSYKLYPGDVLSIEFNGNSLYLFKFELDFFNANSTGEEEKDN